MSGPACVMVSCTRYTKTCRFPKQTGFKTRQRKWIHYHDKHCEKLYGMLPLAVGLPVMLVDHLDHNLVKQLLPSKEGHIHSWVNDLDEKTIDDPNAHERLLSHAPSCVFVDFHTKSWHIPGAPGPGIYPVFQTERTWFLDSYRCKKAVLAIKRKQTPLAPGLACTAYSAQGKTKQAVIGDLVLRRGVSSIASYVAIIHIKNREGLMNYRPFEQKLFTTGIPDGTALLLKMRGGELSWENIEEEMILKKDAHNVKRKVTKRNSHGHNEILYAFNACSNGKENCRDGHIICVKHADK